jgi:hypothetical protein
MGLVCRGEPLQTESLKYGYWLSATRFFAFLESVPGDIAMADSRIGR